MGQFRYISPDEVAKRHRAKTPVALPRQEARSPQVKNVEQVLSLGDVRYITYRNQVYRIPSVPFKMGQRVLDSQIRVLAHAKQVAMTGNPDAMDAFYKEMSKLVDLLWIGDPLELGEHR